MGIVGAWRSLVARFAGGEEVAGSNPVAPTRISKSKPKPQIRHFEGFEAKRETRFSHASSTESLHIYAQRRGLGRDNLHISRYFVQPSLPQC